MFLLTTPLLPLTYLFIFLFLIFFLFNRKNKWWGERKRKVCILDWCYMCKSNCESVDHLFLHCPVASELWDMVFGLFGVYWVMPMSAVGLLACWQGRFGHHHNGDIWMVVPHCLLWCIWKERNNRCFEDSKRSLPDIKLLFFRSLLDWFSVWRNHPFSSILDLLVFCNVRSWFIHPCIPLCTWVSLFLSMNFYYLSKKKKSNHVIVADRSQLGLTRRCRKLVPCCVQLEIWHKPIFILFWKGNSN